MAEEDQDFHIESADAGASDVIPCEAGAIKKGGYVWISRRYVFPSEFTIWVI